MSITKSGNNLRANILKVKENEDTSRLGDRWSLVEDDSLLQRARDGMALEDIAKQHKRSPNAIKLRLCSLVKDDELGPKTTIIAISMKDYKKYLINKQKKDIIKDTGKLKSTRICSLTIGEFLQNIFTTDTIVVNFRSGDIIIDAYFLKARIVVVQQGNSLTDDSIKIIKDELGVDCEIVSYVSTDDSFMKCVSTLHYMLMDRAKRGK